ncbi:MAG TPA: twin-arginine translocase subunit TatC [Verrucomicrobiae bacterium]|jgi:sec-independent protein translocase protein TatC
MAEGDEDIRPEDLEVEGGAIKSFLEHLEDLRWMLIKSAAALFAGMLLCLFATRQIMAIIKWPVNRAAQRHVMLVPEPTNQVVTVEFAGVVSKTFTASSNKLGAIDLGTNRYVTVKMEPVVVGTNAVVTWSVITNAEAPEMSALKLAFLGAADPFLFAIHAAFFGGFILASPFIFYFVGQFVMPALKIREKKYFMRAFFFGTVLFLTGASFAYFVVAPTAVKFAVVYAEWMGGDVPFLNTVDWSSFLFKFMLGMGAGFELPVVLLALVKIGVLNYKKLTAMRRYMIVGNLVLGALLTTPEVFTQVVMAIALQILFEIAVWVAWYWEFQAKRREKAG